VTKSAIAVARPLAKSAVFALTMTVVLAFVAIELGGFTFYDKAAYRAVFTSSSDLQVGDPVLTSGVRVGKVVSLGVHNNTQSEVGFEVKDDFELDDDVSAAVRYKNLTGDRYLELVPGHGSGSLETGATIPLSRTRPALDLDLLLGGLQPLFEGLDPMQINELSTELVSVLQGEGGTLETLLRRIGSFTSTLADKDKVIGDVVTNLNSVLGNLDSHSVELSETISSMQKLVSGLSMDRGRIGESFANVDRLVTSMTGLLVDFRGPFRGMVTQLGRVSKQANVGSGTLNEILRMLPGAYLRIGRLGSRGAGYNLYVCSLRLRLTDPTGKAYYTPYVGPADSVKRCDPGVAPLETPEEREAKAASKDGQ
jgi:phospholipid/cholesterol/gamma-HCH transport system substrate-binding protein